MIVKCPECGKSTIYSSENEFRPFCSQRCQTIDIASWADEKYTIPVWEESPGDNGSSGDD